MGIQMFIDRLEGFKDGIAAAQANGSDIQWDEKQDSIAGWPGTDDFAAAQSNAISSPGSKYGLSHFLMQEKTM